MRSLRLFLITALAMVVSASFIAVAVADREDRRRDEPKRAAKKGQHARAVLVNAAGERIGKVRFRSRGPGRPVWVTVGARNLPPGFHGFHIHSAGNCERPDFKSAQGHLKRESQDHGQHAGDMPVLQVASDGRAWMSFRTDAFTLADLRDADGSSVMVHAKPDNYANIPERYDPDPDAETLATGDAGARIACGTIR